MGHLIHSEHFGKPMLGSQDAMLGKFVQTRRVDRDFYQKIHRRLAKDPKLYACRCAVKIHRASDCQDLFVPAPVLQSLVGDMLLLIICIYLDPIPPIQNC